MSKARGLADLGNAYNDGALSNRNILIKGNRHYAEIFKQVAAGTLAIAGR